MAGIAWLAIFGHRGVAPCVGLMALAVACRRDIWVTGASLMAQTGVFRDPLVLAACAFFLLTVWIAITGLWTPTPGAEWLGLTLASAALAGGALVFEATHASPRRSAALAGGFALMVAAASAALLFEGVSGGYLREITPPTDNSYMRWKDMTSLGRGVTAIAPLVFPAASIIRRLTGSWLIAFAPALALLIAALHFSIFANVAGLVLAGAAFAFAISFPRMGLALTSGLILAALLTAPFAAVAIPADTVLDWKFGELPPSWAQRLVVWREAGSAALQECFPFGCGADYARALSQSGEMIQIPNWPVELQSMPTHPHNVFLQVWLELGIPGVIALFTSIAMGFATLLEARLDRSTVAAICASAAVCFISVMFEASIWQAWRLAVFALAAFAAAVSNAFCKSSRR